MSLPTFLIVGAAKCGTTSLFEYLGQHPDVFVPHCKEPQYFSRAPYPALARNDEEYARLFAGRRGEKAVGEASVSYLCDEEAPGRIKALIPEAKIIILLRDPVERAYSLWWHMHHLGFEPLPFAEALKKEDERRHSPEFRNNAPHYHGFFYYCHSGMYCAQVKRYLDLFGPENVRVRIFEEAVRDLPALCREMFEFIAVDPSFEPELAARNPSHVARFRALQRLLTSPPAVVRKSYAKLPGKLQLAIHEMLRKLYWSNMKEHRRPPLDPALESELRARFADDVAGLEKLLGKDLKQYWRGGGKPRVP